MKKTIFAILFLSLSILFVVMCFLNTSFMDWVFERHQNLWSWYIRPIFIIPLCFFSYKRHFLGISITLFCLFTSMFWFPIPQGFSPRAEMFLQFEKKWLLDSWNAEKWILTAMIPISLVILCLSFWKRSWLLGILVVVLMAFGKIIWSVIYAGSTAKSIIFPAIFGRN